MHRPMAMNQTIIRMIGKLEEDRKACWSEHLPELLMAYNATKSSVTSEEVARQCRYYDRKAGAVALQPGDVVMVHTNGFVGKQKVKD